MKTYLEYMFKLCQEIISLDLSKNLQEQISKMKDTGEYFSNQSLLLQGIRNESDFYIVLIMNELSKQTDSKDNFLRAVTPLNQKELEIFKQLHNVMKYFYEQSLKSIGNLPENLKVALSPTPKYNFKLPYSTDLDVSTIIDTEMFTDVFNYWKRSNLRRIYEKEIIKYESLLNEIGVEKIIQLLYAVGNDIDESGYKNIPNSLKDLRGYNEPFSQRDSRGVLRFFYLLYSIKTIIDISTDFLAMAFKGIKMGVVGEENVISIKSNFSNMLRDGRDFIIYPGLKKDPEVSNLVVIEENLYNKKEFGYCKAVRQSFMNENGTTLECRISVIDEEMNPFNYIDSLYGRQRWR